MLTVIPAHPQDFSYTDVLFQTEFWGRLKKRCSNQTPLYFWVNWDNLQFPLLVLLRKTGDNLYGYAPRAPICPIQEGQRGQLLEQIATAVKPMLPPDTIHFRFDIPWPVPGLDGGERTELAELAMNFGTRHHSLRKAPSDHLSPDTVVLDLRPSTEKIFLSMRQQTRNSVRRAYREKIEFSILDSRSPDLISQLEAWHAIYQETGKRKGFYYESLEYFIKAFECDCVGSSCPRFERNSPVPMDANVPTPKLYLITASKDGKMLSGLVLALCGKMAYYMYAASSLESRQSMPNYGLQWEVIRFARSKGCTGYDLMGIPPTANEEHPMKGLFIFKTGFGGNRVHFGGCWDFVYDQKRYSGFAMNESMQLHS